MSEALERLTAALADRYRIERELGAGGMATVYLAEDLRHDRKVALKVLRPELAAVIGAARFLIEIKTTANLQHPHILSLHDSGEVEGTVFYVMPYVEGESLRDRLNRDKQLPVEEAVRIATEVASALEYAHGHQVIHRDIKPENILLQGNHAVVADFGIALAAVRSDSGTRMTETGMSLGTPHYMSPEQAMGEREITAKSDVYALGCVLYETLTGEPPFTGPTAQAIVARVMTEEPRSLTLQRRTIPRNVEAAVHRALSKLPADRFASASAFAAALADSRFGARSIEAGAVATPARRGRSALAVWATGAVAVLALAAAGWGWLRPAPVAATTRFDLSLGGIVVAGNDDVVISPDGSMLAVAGTLGGGQAIYLRRVGEPDWQKVLGTEDGSRPSFSPDNGWIVFRRPRDGNVIKVAVTGGGAMTLAGGLGVLLDLHWGTDDQIVLFSNQGVSLVQAAAGPPKRLAKAGGRQPFLLPDGSGVLHIGGGNVSVLDITTDSSTVLIPNARHPSYVETGHLLYVAEDGGLFAVPFDLGEHRVTGPAVRVLDRVASTNVRRGYSVSRNGVLVQYEGASSLIGGAGPQNRFALIGPGGKMDTIPLPAGTRLHPRLSPDGRTIAYEFGDPGRNGQSDIYTFDLVTGTNTQITFDGDNDDPVWSPDGKRILFDKDVEGAGEDLHIKAADNSSAEERVLTMPGNQVPTNWLDEQTVLLESATGGGGPPDLLVYSLKEKGAAKPYLAAPWAEFGLGVSPDRTLAAFGSTESGNPEVWLQTWPVPQGKWRVSFGGGLAPRWSPDGKDVYFWRGAGVDTLFRARVDRAPGIVVRAAERVLLVDVAGFENWDLHPDGKRFLVTVPAGAAPEPAAAAGAGAPASRYLVALNWFTQLRELTGKRKR